MLLLREPTLEVQKQVHVVDNLLQGRSFQSDSILCLRSLISWIFRLEKVCLVVKMHVDGAAVYCPFGEKSLFMDHRSHITREVRIILQHMQMDLGSKLL